MTSPIRRRLGGGLASFLLVALAAGCGDTDPPQGEPTSPEASSTSSSIQSYNDTENDGEPPAEDHEGSDRDANPDAEETDR